MTIQQAIAQTIKDWEMTPDQINNGNCDNFAGDAECPQGVNNWQDLPLFARQAIQK